jgi:hypothetical protein
MSVNAVRCARQQRDSNWRTESYVQCCFSTLKLNRLRIIAVQIFSRTSSGANCDEFRAKEFLGLYTPPSCFASGACLERPGISFGWGNLNLGNDDYSNLSHKAASTGHVTINAIVKL